MDDELANGVVAVLGLPRVLGGESGTDLPPVGVVIVAVTPAKRRADRVLG